MKKTAMSLFALLILASGLRIGMVHAYSPHYLPGGKNYLSPDNFELSDLHFLTIDPFLVKPYTDYCLTISSSYVDNIGGEIILGFYEDVTLIETLSLDSVADFTMVFGSNYLSYTFQTSAKANYLSVSFDDDRDFFLGNDPFGEFQLEEGTVSTAMTSVEDYIEGDLIDTNGPYFGGSGVVISSVADPLTLAEIQSGLYAYDAVSGNVSSTIGVVSDAYTGNGGILGNYLIVFRAADSIGNTTDFTCTVKVVDVTKPVLTGQALVSVPFPGTFTIAQLKALVFASDNYDGDITSRITVVSDAYTPSGSILGVYAVVFRATDLSGNAQTFTMNVSVIDQAAPVFSGISEVTLGYDQTMTVAQIQASLTAFDDYDEDVTAQIAVQSDGFTTHCHQIGEYVVVFVVEDSSGNTTEKTVFVRVVDEIGPIIYFDTSIVKVYDTTVLSLTDFTTLLQQAGELDESLGYGVTVAYDSYSDHATVPGVYHLTLEFKSPDGEVLTKAFQIIVKDRAEDFIVPLPNTPMEAIKIFLFENQTWVVGGFFLSLALLTNLLWLLPRRKGLKA